MKGENFSSISATFRRLILSMHPQRVARHYSNRRFTSPFAGPDEHLDDAESQLRSNRCSTHVPWSSVTRCHPWHDYAITYVRNNGTLSEEFTSVKGTNTYARDGWGYISADPEGIGVERVVFMAPERLVAKVTTA
jgi:hypothetical protein